VYQAPEGYSLDTPPGWTTITEQNQLQLPPAAAAWLKKNRLDLRRLSLVVVKPTLGDFAENLNVVVEHQQMPLNGDSVRTLLEVLPTQLQKIGVKTKNVRVSTNNYGGNEAIVVEFESILPLFSQPVAQKQVYFAGGGKTFIVTCTSLASSRAQFEPVFERTLATMKIAGGSQSATSAKLTAPFSLPLNEGENNIQFGKGSGDVQADELALLAQSGAFRFDDWNHPMNRFTLLMGLGIIATIVKSAVAIFKH
jgi:hypothetical protein